MNSTSRATTVGLAALVLLAGGTPAQAGPTRHGSTGVADSPGPAVRVVSTHIPPLATIGGVSISGGGYGSGLVAKPGSSNIFFGLTDRGPNVDGPNGTKVEPLPDFQSAIGEFRFTGDRAHLLRRIPLSAFDGAPYSGRVNTQATTGETILDLQGNVLPPDDNGYDPEGLVALGDGTFWVSDEYGPFITHFDRTGRAIERLSPFDGTLPRELKNRVPNKGMEGLTVTPDGRTLVGVMQSALQQTDLTAKPAKVPVLRVVTVDLRSRASHEYVYLLDDPGDTSSAASEITALSSHTFLVDERDGAFEPGAYKKLWKIDLRGATDIGRASGVPGSSYDASQGGLVVGGHTPEGLVGAATTADAKAALESVGIAPVRKSLYLDLGGLLTSIDPTGGFFGHDKIEGVAALSGGQRLVISNDSDFGIMGLTGDAPPFQLTPKILPNGQQDDGEFLVVDVRRVPADFR